MAGFGVDTTSHAANGMEEVRVRESKIANDPSEEVNTTWTRIYLQISQPRRHKSDKEKEDLL